MTLILWAAIITLAATLIAGVDELLEARDRRRRIQRLRERRAYLDNVEPKRWTTR